MVVLPGQQEELFSTFLSSRKILIADPYGASRSGLAKILVGLGAKLANLMPTDNYEEALRIIQKEQPEIIIADYTIGKNNGLELSQETRHYNKKDEKVFVLVTGNSSQCAVAQAAEEDVDVFILKPYTIKGFSDILMKTVLAKVTPSDYLKEIRVGKKILEDGDTDKALVHFEKATKLHEKPTLAFYYQAQAKLVKKLMTEAETSYNSGLQVNNLHYKCLTGFFDLLIYQKRNQDAYKIIKQIARSFPANPSRLGQVLTLAINTGNYADIEQYYETFKEIEIRNDDLVRYICASLVVCGKHYFRIKDKDRALEFLKKATVSAAGKPNILREIITVLVENKLIPEAQEVAKRFSNDTDPHFLVADFLIKNESESDKTKLIPELRTLVRNGIKEPVIYYWLIFHLVDFDKVDEAEEVCDDALRIWPEKEDYFNSALKLKDEDLEE